MDLNRHHYFAIGVILLLLGIQFRFVESYTLTAESTQFIEKKIIKSQPTAQRSLSTLLNVATPPQRNISFPRWLGFSLISLGAVLSIHSLAMKKPD